MDKRVPYICVVCVVFELAVLHPQVNLTTYPIALLSPD